MRFSDSALRLRQNVRLGRRIDRLDRIAESRDRHPWARVETARLALATLPEAALRAIDEGRLAEAGDQVGCNLLDFPTDHRDIVQMRLSDLDRDPDYLPWSLRALCLKPDLRFIGYFNFHSRPDPEYLRDLAPGAVELGYFILPEFRRRGLAEEAALAMMGWAAREHGIRRFIVSISPDNAASMAMARKLGFSRIGGHQDEIDGYEDILALTHSPASSL